MQQSLLVKWVLILLLIVLGFTILIEAKTALIPLVLAGLLAMLFIPLSNKMERKGISRGLASFIAVLCFLVIISCIISLFIWQLKNIIDELASVEKKVSARLQELQIFLYRNFSIKPDAQKKMIQEEGAKAGAVIANLMGSVLNVFFNLILVMVYMFLLLYLRTRIKNFILKLVATPGREKAKKIISQSGAVIQKYLLGLSVMIVMLWIMYGIGFTLAGVKNALFFAVVCGTCEIIPFVGNLAGNILAILMVLSQGGGISMVLSVLIIYSVVQFIQSYLIQPYIVGGEVNINPFFTIFVLVIGELVWGVAGMILAIPLTAVARIIFDNIESLKPYGYLIGGDKKEKKNGFLLKIKRWFK
jgi:predicted PurR-regulated permease PerM